jgi:hypothetical protein
MRPHIGEACDAVREAMLLRDGITAGLHGVEG